MTKHCIIRKDVLNSIQHTLDFYIEKYPFHPVCQSDLDALKKALTHTLDGWEVVPKVDFYCNDLTALQYSGQDEDGEDIAYITDLSSTHPFLESEG